MHRGDVAVQRATICLPESKGERMGEDDVCVAGFVRRLSWERHLGRPHRREDLEMGLPPSGNDAWKPR